MSFLSEFTPGAAILTYIAAIVTFHYGKLHLDSKKLTNEEKQANREGFTRQVESLWSENRKLREDYDQAEERARRDRELCRKETDALRQAIVSWEDRWSGAVRKMADITIRAARGDVDSELVRMITTLQDEVKSNR